MTKRGRPAHGITETSITFRAPAQLVGAMARRAAREGLTASEGWRRAARAWLGLKPDAYERYLNERE